MEETGYAEYFDSGLDAELEGLWRGCEGNDVRRGETSRQAEHLVEYKPDHSASAPFD